MYLGIDLGTSSVKIVLLNEQLQLVASASKPLTLSHPQPVWAEQQPADWWQATQDALTLLQSTHTQELSQVRAIGLAGQQHGAVLLDHQGEVLRPAILWNDGRALAQCELLLSRQPDALAITGNQIMPGFTAPKLLWVQQHEPDIFARVATVLLPKDYLRFCLSGEYATDVSDTSGTSWLNVRERAWSSAMLAATELSLQHMPKLYEGTAISGLLKNDLAHRFGLPFNTPIIAGGGDNAASAISMNIIAPGRAFLSLGTSGVYFVADSHYHANPAGGLHTMCHCLPQRWHQMSVHLNAASALSWWARLQGADLAQLLQEARTHTGRNDVLFLPYLSGERTPHNNPYASGVFFGLTANTSRAEMTQAVLTGVAYAFADGQDAIAAAGVNINEVVVIGGGSRSLYWGKILANVLQRPLIYYHDREAGAAIGAARLAWLGLHSVASEQAFAAGQIETIIEPDPDWIEHYQQQRLVFQKVYRSLDPLFIP